MPPEGRFCTRPHRNLTVKRNRGRSGLPTSDRVFVVVNATKATENDDALHAIAVRGSACRSKPLGGSRDP
jgi:hypothetical protein